MKLFRFFDAIFVPKTAYAHCDIPCGIYDPYAAQVAAWTVVRMTDLIMDKKAADGNLTVQDASQIARLTKVKESHAEIVKHEVRVIWGDYFKSEMLEKNKQVNGLVFDIMKKASKAKQEVNKEEALNLVNLVQEFAQIFWQTKDRQTQRVKTGFPTEGEVVVPK